MLVGLSMQASAQMLELRYGHINAPGSAAGIQAQMFADAIARKAKAQIRVTVSPSSELGKLQELTEAASTGTIALSHSTAGSIGSLYEPVAALDTPYLYRDYDHLMKVTDGDSPVMKKLNEGLIKAAGLRVLYAYYFGTRHLTANKAMLQPSDLAGQKIRAVAFPIYIAAIHGLGGIPIQMDLSELPNALATGQVAGQENPVNVVMTSKLYEAQSHLMLTGHIMNAQLVVINERIWQKLAPAQRDALRAAAQDVRKRASAMVKDQEAEETGKLRALGMSIIGLESGLNLDAFKASVNKVVQAKFGAKFEELYTEIAAIK
jgi:tripartite ATP-independent transporter DctP family solute receptor